MDVQNCGRNFVVAVLLLAGLAGAGCQQQTAQNQPPTPPPSSPVERGQYLITISGCNDCHTPLKMGPKGPEPDMARMLSGHPENVKASAPPKFPQQGWIWGGTDTMTAFAGPWGITYSSNITPDQNTGIGIWSEDMFIKTIRNGRHMAEGRPLLPPMPWMWVAKMSDDDLKAVYAYLRSIPPVSNRVPEYQEPAGPPM